MNVHRLKPKQSPPPSGGQPIFNNLPQVLKFLLLCHCIGFGIQYLAQESLTPLEYAKYIYLNFAFIPARYGMESYTFAHFISPLSYQFLHGGFIHFGINMLLLIAFGSGVAKVMRPGALASLYLISGVGAAFVHGYFYQSDMTPVIGASGSVYGLFGALVWIMYRSGTYRKHPIELLKIIAVMVLVMFITGQGDLMGTGANIAWVAHIGGFFMGLILYPILSPPAKPHIKDE